MSISSNSTVPELILEVNVIKKEVRYRSVTKTIPDTYWKDEISTFLYPTWDSDKDKLVLFGWYSNNTYIAQRRKYSKNFKTGEFYWKDYEMEQLDESASAVFEKFKEAFFLVDSLETQEYEQQFAKIYAETASVSWLSVRLARNFLLDETDHVFIEDSPYSDEDKALYRLYRQKLRDLPSEVTSTDPADIKFPIDPKYYKSIWLEKNPDTVYLNTENQFVKLSSHYFTTFREKFSSYLMVKSLTDGVYFSSFMSALKQSGVVWNEETPMFQPTQEQIDKGKQLLDTLLAQVEAEGGS